MKFKNSSGQIILEALISVALFSLVAFSVALVLRDSLDVLINEMKRQKAVYLAREGMEAIWAIAKDEFEKLESGIYGLKISSGKWELIKEQQSENGFFREIIIEDEKNFEEVKEVKVKIKWQNPQLNKEDFVSLSGYFVNQKTFGLQLNSSSYLISSPTPWQSLSYTILLSILPKNLSPSKGAGLFANQTASPEEGSNLLQIESDENLNYQLRIGQDTFLIGPILNKWTQLIITYDGENLKTYYNGKERVSQVLPEREIEFQSYLLGISADQTKSFEGIYKNLMIFDRALNQKEISDLFSGKIPSLEGLRLYWKMNEGEGNLVKDYSPFNVSGNITSQPLWKEILNLSSWKRVADF
jgi:hypothetical protein